MALASARADGGSAPSAADGLGVGYWLADIADVPSCEKLLDALPLDKSDVKGVSDILNVMGAAPSVCSSSLRPRPNLRRAGPSFVDQVL